MSSILLSLIAQNTAEIIWDIAVASATPGTPQLKPATNHISRKIFKVVAKSRYNSADSESPRPLKIPERILKYEKPQLPIIKINR